MKHILLLCFVWSLSVPSGAYAQDATTQPTSQPTTQPTETESVEESTTDEDPPKTTTSEEATDALSPEEAAMLEAALAEDAAGETSVETEMPDAPRSGDFLDIAVILDVAASYFSEEPDQRGAHDPNQTGFTLQQLELSLNANVDPFFSFSSNLVFSLFGVEVEEAYASTTALPANLIVRAGQFLTRFGRINPTHPHSWSFVDQPIVNGKFFGGESSRGLGAEVSWLSPLPWFVEVVGSVNNADGACCARSFYGADNPGIDGPQDLLYTTAIKQLFAFSPSTSLSWGLSAQFGPNASGFGNRTEIYGTDLYLRYRPASSSRRTAVSWTTEFMFRTRQIPNDVLQDYGLYSQIVWTIDPRWEVGARYEFVSGLDDDPLDPEWTETRQRGSLQATFYPSHFSRIRLQPMVDDIPGRDLIGGVMLNLEILAGAHGAHDF